MELTVEVIYIHGYISEIQESIENIDHYRSVRPRHHPRLQRRRHRPQKSYH